VLVYGYSPSVITRKTILLISSYFLIAAVALFIGWEASNDEIDTFQKMLGDVSSVSSCMSKFNSKREENDAFDSTSERLKYELCYSVIIGQG
jgi:hypothetical protein